MKKRFLYGMCFLIVLFLFATGCQSRQTQKEQEEKEKFPAETVFSKQKLLLNEVFGRTKWYVTAKEEVYVYSEEERSRLFCLRTDTEEVAKVDISSLRENEYPVSMTKDTDGNTVLFTTRVLSKNSKQTIDWEISQYRISENMLSAHVSFSEKLSGTDFALQEFADILQIRYDDEGNLYLLQPEAVWVVDKEYRLLAFHKQQMQNPVIGKTKEGQLYILYEKDAAEGEIGVLKKQATEGFLETVYCTETANIRLLPSETGIYFSTPEGICTYAEEEKKSIALLSYESAGLPDGAKYYTVSTEFIYMLAKDRFHENCVALTSLKKHDKSQQKEKKMLRFATVQTAWDTAEIIMEFNEQNPDYKIETVQYFELYQNEYQTRFGIDLANGVTYDLISTDLIVEQADSLVKRGYFENLFEYLDTDSVLNRRDLVGAALYPVTKEGCLYAMPTGFYMSTLVGEKDKMQSYTEWNFDEFYEYVLTLPKDCSLYARISKMSTMYDILSLHQFMNPSKESLQLAGAYTDTLRLIQEYRPDVFTDRNQNANLSNEDIKERIRDGSIALHRVTIHDLNHFYEEINQVFPREAVLVGFPSFRGNGTFYHVNNATAICSASEEKEGAWEFIRFMLREVYQNSMTSGFPVRKSAVEKSIERFENRYADKKGKLKQQEMLDALYQRLVSDTEGLTVADYKYSAIVLEEAPLYFHGGKTLEDTISAISSRINLLLWE